MGAIASAISDAAVGASQVAASVANNNRTNATNLQIAQETNKTNAANVAATNAANIQMNDFTNQANLAINQATNAANIQMNAATNQANLDIANVTNKANAEIAQMNNQYNEQMLERQIQQEWDMWNAQNEYNTPAAQMQRQREAGLNPFVAANSGSISSGNASSMSSPAAQPAASYTAQGAMMTAPTLQPTSLTPGHVDAFQAQMVGVSPADLSAMDGLRGIVGSYFDIRDKQTQIEHQELINDGVRIENQYKAQQLEAAISNTLADTDSKRTKTGLDKIQQKYMDEIYNTDLRQKNQELFFRQLQSAGQMISNLSALEWYKVLPTQIKQTINEQATRINNMRLTGRYTQEQIKTEIERQVSTMYDHMLKGQEYQMNAETWNVTKRKITADMINAMLEPASTPWGYVGRAMRSAFSNSWIDYYDPSRY